MKSTRDVRSLLQQAALLCGLLFICTATISAQDWDDTESRSSLTIGPGFHSGASIIIKPPKNLEILPTFAWKAEVHATYPLSPIIDAGLGLGYEKRGTYIHFFDAPNSGGHNRVGYFFLHPHFSFSGFSLGTVFGFPLSEPNDETFSQGEGTSVMIEPRIEGIINIAELEQGWFSLVIGGGYSLTPLVETPDFPGADTTFGTWNHVAAYLGFRYEFAIPGTSRK